LHERHIDELLCEEDVARSTQENYAAWSEHRKTSFLYDSKPALTCQIRLFHPFSKETNGRLRYVAVLKENKDGSWLVAPFGRFSEPAVPGEWKTGRKAPSLRILCIWNARWMARSILERSWVVDRMPASKIEHALVIQQFLAEGKEPSRLFSNQIGPPLIHPLDPRMEYLEEERAWFSALSAKHTLGKGIDLPSTVSSGEDHSLPLAAEKHGKYRIGVHEERPKKGV
jgi:hypothetical protein